MSFRESSFWTLGLAAIAGLLLLAIYAPYLTWDRDGHTGSGNSSVVLNDGKKW